MIASLSRVSLCTDSRGESHQAITYGISRCASPELLFTFFWHANPLTASRIACEPTQLLSRNWVGSHCSSEPAKSTAIATPSTGAADTYFIRIAIAWYSIERISIYKWQVSHNQKCHNLTSHSPFVQQCTEYNSFENVFGVIRCPAEGVGNLYRMTPSRCTLCTTRLYSALNPGTRPAGKHSGHTLIAKVVSTIPYNSLVTRILIGFPTEAKSHKQISSRSTLAKWWFDLK